MFQSKAMRFMCNAYMIRNTSIDMKYQLKKDTYNCADYDGNNPIGLQPDDRGVKKCYNYSKSI